MEPHQPSALADLSNIVVLVVDDDADHCTLLEHLLSRQRARVIRASCAAEGLEAITRHCPDVVISDLEMAGGDGFGFMQCLRSAADDYPRLIPAIALTSLSGEAHRRRAREAGFWCYLEKPVVASVLCEEVARMHHTHRRFRRTG